MSYRATDERLLTAEEFQRLPDDGYRMELVEGRVVREPPAGAEHGRLAHRVAYFIERFLRDAATGVAGTVYSECGFVLSETPWTVRAPDVAFVRAERIPDERLTGYFAGAPDLAVEIVSPSNSAGDVQAKVRRYLNAGARLVWVVYPDTRTVAVHESADLARFMTDSDTLSGGDVLPGLEITVAAIFE